MQPTKKENEKARRYSEKVICYPVLNVLPCMTSVLSDSVFLHFRLYVIQDSSSSSAFSTCTQGTGEYDNIINN